MLFHPPEVGSLYVLHNENSSCLGIVGNITDEFLVEFHYTVAIMLRIDVRSFMLLADLPSIEEVEIYHAIRQKATLPNLVLPDHVTAH